MEKLELASRSSTCCLDSSSSGQVAWPKMDMAALSDDCEKLVQKRNGCIHNSCIIHDKAQRPSVFKSTPSTAVSVQMNYVHNSTSPTTIKERSTIPARMSCCLDFHVNGCSPSLELHWKRVLLSWHPAMHSTVKKKVSPRHSGHRFNTSTATGEKRKKADSSLYLDELLIQKCKFRHRFTVKS